MNEDVSPVKNGDFPAKHFDFFLGVTSGTSNHILSQGGTPVPCVLSLESSPAWQQHRAVVFGNARCACLNGWNMLERCRLIVDKTFFKW